MVVLDKEGMHEEIEKFYEQAEKGWDAAHGLKITEPVSKIIIACIGGSSTAGHLLKQYLSMHKLPVFVVQDYKLPAFAGKDSLVFVLCYGEESGEAVSMYRDAYKKGCQIVSIGDGGKINELSNLNGTKYIMLPRITHKNISYAYLFFSMLKVLDNSELIESQDDFVRKTLKVLKYNNFEELTKEMSEKLAGKIPLIYASPDFEAVAFKWKASFNINTKLPAFYNVFPKLSYDEITGFMSLNEQFYVLIIKSDSEDNKMRKIISESKDLIRRQGVPVTEVAITGDCYLTKLFSAALIGDWISYSLAINSGVDPTPTPLIDELKKRL